LPAGRGRYWNRLTRVHADIDPPPDTNSSFQRDQKGELTNESSRKRPRFSENRAGVTKHPPCATRTREAQSQRSSEVPLVARSRLKSQVVIDAEILVSPQEALISSCTPAIEYVSDSAHKDFASEGA
jgi:hypothetical protein